MYGHYSSYSIPFEEPLMPPLTELPKHYSKKLPCLESIFVGRDSEILQLMDLLSFHKNYSTRIVGIFGGPGLGKSTLAIEVGHKILSRSMNDKVDVEYYDLSEISFVPYLLHRILGDGVNSTDHLGMIEELKCWAENTITYKLLLFDGCDKLFSGNQKSELQRILSLILKHSSNIKILFTSRHRISFIGQFKSLDLEELKQEHAINLLQRLSSKLSKDDATKIAESVGSVPLALQIVGALLETNLVSLSTILSEIIDHPLETLTSDLLPIKSQVVTSIRLSYDNLDEHSQTCARFLANFPGSFSKDAAISVLSHMVNNTYWYADLFRTLQIYLHWIPTPSHCLDTLVHRSLLKYHSNLQRYSFHKLIQVFLNHQSKPQEIDIFKRGFAIYFSDYWDSFHDSAFEGNYDPQILAFLDLERHNFEMMENILPELGLPGIYLFMKKFVNSAEIYTKDAQSMVTYLSHLKTEFATTALTTTESYTVKERLERYYKFVLMLDCHSQIVIKDKGPKHYMETFVTTILQMSALEDYLYGVDRALQSLKGRSQRIIELYEKYGDVVAKSVDQYFEQIKKYSYDSEDIDTLMEALQVKIRMTLPPSKCSTESSECKDSRKGLAYFGAGKYKKAIRYYNKYLNQEIPDHEYLYTLMMLYYCHYFNGQQEKATEIVKRLDFQMNRIKVYLLVVDEKNVKKAHILSLFYGKIRPGSYEHQIIRDRYQYFKIIHQLKVIHHQQLKIIQRTRYTFLELE